MGTISSGVTWGVESLEMALQVGVEVVVYSGNQIAYMPTKKINYQRILLIDVMKLNLNGQTTSTALAVASPR